MAGSRYEPVDTDATTDYRLLDNDPEDKDCLQYSTETSWGGAEKRLRMIHVTLLILNIMFVISNIIIYRSLITSNRTDYGPSGKINRYHRQFFNLNLGETTIFTKDMSAETQKAWDEISAPPGKVGLVKVQRKELDRRNLTSIPLADGTGYIATIDVFHQLHCLDFLRRATSPSSPHEHDMGLRKEHVDHCIDSLRLSLQCHADTSLLTFKWIKDYALPWPDFRSYHTCRDFGAILKWAQEEMFETDVSGMFIHPQYGPLSMNLTAHMENPLKRTGRVEFLEPV